MKKRAGGLAMMSVLGGLAFLPIGGTEVAASSQPALAPGKVGDDTMDLSAFPETRPERSLRLLLLHHSVGGALFASPGAEAAVARCIWKTHPDGGGARSLLESHGYEVNEASYGSLLGERTDLFDWAPKFRDQMDKVLTCDESDRFYEDGRKNDVVIFKSCYPQNRFVGEGTAPGNPAGPELTLWNARAALTSILPELQKHPDTLFVYLTAPPQAPAPPVPLWKFVAKKALGKPQYRDVLASQSALARRFSHWALSPDGWLKGYPLKNVVVFDLFNTLTGGNGSDVLRYTARVGDSHPSRAGNEAVTRELVPFINRATRRARLVK